LLFADASRFALKARQSNTQSPEPPVHELMSLNNMINALAAAVSPSKIYGRLTGREPNPTEGPIAMPDHTTNFHGPVQIGGNHQTVHATNVGTAINNGTVNNRSSSEDDSEGDEDVEANGEQSVSRKNGLPVIPGALVKHIKKEMVSKEHVKANIKYFPYLCHKAGLRKELLSKLKNDQEIEWEPAHYLDFATSLEMLHGGMTNM
jgi:hypothetical protein